MCFVSVMHNVYIRSFQMDIKSVCVFVYMNEYLNDRMLQCQSKVYIRMLTNVEISFFTPPFSHLLSRKRSIINLYSFLRVLFEKKRKKERK